MRHDLPGLVEVRERNQLRLKIARHPNQNGPVIDYMRRLLARLMEADRAKYPEIYEAKPSTYVRRGPTKKNHCQACGVFIYHGQTVCSGCSRP